MREIELQSGRRIGDGAPVFVIAEVGINHDGDMDKARQLVDAAAKAGADAVKLQTYDTEQRVPKDSPVYDILKTCELSYDQQSELFELGRQQGIEMFSTPFDAEAVEFLQSVGANLYKIASFDSVNSALLRKVGETGRPVIMSTGMTNVEELGEAWRSLGGQEDGTGCELALMHCISAYPLRNADANLSVIGNLKTLHGGPVGYSDHSIGVEVPALAVAAGAQIIEKHFTLDCAAEGPDHAMSADPVTLGEMTAKIREVESIMGDSALRLRDAELAIEPYRRHSN